MTYEEARRIIDRGDVITLRRALADGLDPNLSNKYGWTLLASAAGRGNSLVGELLIEYGADIEIRNKFGDTALANAAFESTSFFRMLLRKGACLSCRADGLSLDTYLDWVIGMYPAKTKGMREALEEERERRAKRDEELEGLIRS